MHFSLVKIHPEALPENFCVEDVMLPLYYALGRLGYDAEMRVNTLNPASVNILFGQPAHVRRLGAAVPANSVFFMLEDLPPDGENDTAADDLHGFTFWDYSARRVNRLGQVLGPGRAVQVRLGYVPEMTRLVADFPKSRDALFYGGINERRRLALDALAAVAPRLDAQTALFGTHRDLAIARSRLVLNIHAACPAVLELPRLGYLWANKQPVLSECGPETEMFPGLEDACAWCAYDDLAPAAKGLLSSKARLEHQGEKGFAAFSALRQETFLEAVVGRRNYRSALPVPDRLNAGSGSDFRHDCLNVDINPRVNPDLVLDLSLPLDPTRTYDTMRFGAIRLMPGTFSLITARDVLEHVQDLQQLMSNFLELLKDDGVLEIGVPYDLSQGAWQDPTHVRAFNENSWTYYCEWAWYIGWRNNRFQLDSLTYVLGPYGQELADSGMAWKDVTYRARAVRALDVTLRKRRSTTEEQEEFDRLTRSYYSGAVGEWLLPVGGDTENEQK